MKKKYIFLDTDITGSEEYDISGKEYETLIKKCCKYSSILSLRICRNSKNCIDELEKYRCRLDNNLLDYTYAKYSLDADDCIRYYQICPGLEKLLLTMADSIMSWVSTWGKSNPEDPVFYREDGSVFFSSIIHEGICSINPLETEEISSIVSNPLWKEAD